MIPRLLFSYRAFDVSALDVIRDTIELSDRKSGQMLMHCEGEADTVAGYKIRYTVVKSWRS